MMGESVRTLTSGVVMRHETGIDKLTSARIYDALYEQSIGDSEPDVGLLAMTEVSDIDATDDGTYHLRCEQWQEESAFVHETDVVILATGYERPEPMFLAPLEDQIYRDDEGRLEVSEDFRLETGDLPGDIFVQNAELHTHGINAPDLGLGCYRNAVILNTLLGEAVYPAGRASTFQDFKVESFVENRDARFLEESSVRSD